MTFVCDGVYYLYWSNWWNWTAIEVIIVAVVCLITGILIGSKFLGKWKP